ncbi:MAG: hypothetical protein P8M78_14805 [Myxococcota bacterium]|nr:hypothetical protein [Myxococcota bacterium]
MLKWVDSIPRFFLFSCLLIPFVGSVAEAGGRSLSGSWSTRQAVPYLQQLGGEEPDLFYTELVWTLTEDGNGLISGFSDFVAFDAEGTEVSSGQLKLVGSRFGRSFAMAQGDLSQSGDTGMTFQCTLRGSKRTVCLGTSTGSLSPLGLRLILTRTDD